MNHVAFASSPRVDRLLRSELSWNLFPPGAPLTILRLHRPSASTSIVCCPRSLHADQIAKKGEVAKCLLLPFLPFTFFASTRIRMARFPVFHTPLSLLHDPPHEILSGCVQPYFESPERYHRILDALLEDQDTYEEYKMPWKAGEVDTDELREAVRRVHDEDYSDFLREIYDEWVAEGGSKVRKSRVSVDSVKLTSLLRGQEAVLPETFLRNDLLLEPSLPENVKESAIARTGVSSFVQLTRAEN